MRQAESLPTPPPGVGPGSAADRLFREEAYQVMRLQITDMRRQLREFDQQKRQQFETMKKEVVSATPSSQRLADSA
jgi:hypothetical protein